MSQYQGMMNGAFFAPTAYAIPPECKDPDYMSFLPADAEVWEDNLPSFMASIEAGTLSIGRNGVPKWTAPVRKRPDEQFDNDDHKLLSPSTGLLLYDMPFLPDRISQEVSGWRLWYWKRKLADLGIEMKLEDIYSRMQFDVQPLSKAKALNQIRTLSYRMQRYAMGVGILPFTQKIKGPLAFPQNMETIADLTILQGKLNTN